MPPVGEYILTNVGFSSDEKPLLLLQKDDAFVSLYPINEQISLTFDTSTRYCTGWRDISTGERFVCPDHQVVPIKYEQCTACQKRTGFNPAFYHAASVSEKQEVRNSEPHILYLAHFSNGVIKVGISHAKRGHGRLLEQGARSALILDTLPSAHIARQYEAKIAAMPGIVETIQVAKKLQLITRPYDHIAAKEELLAIKTTIESVLAVNCTGSSVLTFDDTYFPNTRPSLISAHDVAKINRISGGCVGLLGSVLFCTQADSLLYLPLKKYVGYNLRLDNTVSPIDLPAQQTSLFSL